MRVSAANGQLLLGLALASPLPGGRAWRAASVKRSPLIGITGCHESSSVSSIGLTVDGC